MAAHKLNIGDKVRFLNESGEGIVRGFEKNLVKVEVDGFIIPYVGEQLVVISDTSAPKEEKRREFVKPAEEDKRDSFKVVDSVYMAYEDKGNGQGFQMWLINNTMYEVLFSFGTTSGMVFKGKERGVVIPLERVMFAEFDASQINAFANFRIQMLFHNEVEMTEKLPVNEYVKMKTARFFKPGSFIRSKLTVNPALIIDLLDISGESEAVVREETWKGDGVKITNIAEHIYKKEKSESPRLSSPHITRTGELEKEVDLHIEELIETVRGMSNAEILRIQLQHFQRELDDAIASRMKRVTFIHGIGNGVLKGEIRRMLAGYDGVKYFDAPYSRYGFGATEVEIY